MDPWKLQSEKAERKYRRGILLILRFVKDLFREMTFSEGRPFPREDFIWAIHILYPPLPFQLLISFHCRNDSFINCQRMPACLFRYTQMCDNVIWWCGGKFLSKLFGSIFISINIIKKNWMWLHTSRIVFKMRFSSKKVSCWELFSKNAVEWHRLFILYGENGGGIWELSILDS